MERVRFQRYLCTLTLVSGAVALPVPAPAQTARLIAQKASPSVALLVMRDAGEQPLSLGSGFFVTDNVIATNVHVIAKAAAGDVKLAGRSQTYRISGLVGSDEEHDLALVKISGANGAALPIGDSEKLAVGDEVYVLGNPEGLEGTLSNGIVSAIRQIGTERILQITAPISPGSSGGPVLDQQGQVVGVAFATFKEGQNLNFAIPSAYLAKLIRTMTAVCPLPSTHITVQSVLDLGPPMEEAVLITHRKLRQRAFERARLEFSIENRLPRPISNVTILVVYRDASGAPFHSEMKQYLDRIEPNVAQRIDESKYERYGECPVVPEDVVVWLNVNRRKDHDRTNKEIVKSGGFIADSDVRFIEMRVLGFRVDQ